MKKTILLLLGMISGFLLYSQEQVIDENSEKFKYLLKYNVNPATESDRTLNSMLDQLNGPHHRIQTGGDIIFSYVQHYRVTKKGVNINIYFDLKNLNVNGDAYYKKFSVSSAFIPGVVSMTLKLSGRRQPNDPWKLLNRYNIVPTEINDKKNSFTFDYKDTLKMEHFIAEGENVRFIFNDKNKRYLNDLLNSIDDYYKSVERIEKVYGDLMMVNPDDADHLADAQNILSNSREFLHETEKLDLVKRLDLQNFDPLDFVKKLHDTRELVHKLAEAVNHTISILYEIYYNKGLNALAYNDKVLARNMFMKSLQSNPMFAPSEYQLAKMDLLDSYYDDCAKKLTILFNQMTPDENTARIGMELMYNLVTAYMGYGDHFYNDKNYRDALSVYIKIESFCHSIRNYSCPEALNNKIVLSKTGIYNSYLDNANTFISQGKLADAENQVNLAIDFQNGNSDVVPDNLAAISLMNRIKQLEYLNYIRDGKGYLNAKNNETAFESFQKAEELEKKYPFNKSPELPGFLRLTAKNVIIEELGKGIKLANQNLLKEARSCINRAITLQTNYNLNGEKDINNLVASLRQKIFSQECMNAQNEMDTYMNRARSQIYNKNFIMAENELNGAEEVLRKNSECSLDRSILDSTRNYITPALNNQKLLVEINNNLNNNFFEKALTGYLLAEKQFSQFNLSRFGIECKPVMDFISGERNDFVIYCLNHYLNNDDPDKSLGLMKVLRTRNYKSRKLKTEQKILGTKLSLRDLKTSNGQKPEQSVLNYTNGDSWYKNLKKAYLKARK